MVLRRAQRVLVVGSVLWLIVGSFGGFILVAGWEKDIRSKEKFFALFVGKRNGGTKQS
jgi:hypothetical protein